MDINTLQKIGIAFGLAALFISIYTYLEKQQAAQVAGTKYPVRR